MSSQDTGHRFQDPYLAHLAQNVTVNKVYEVRGILQPLDVSALRTASEFIICLFPHKQMAWLGSHVLLGFGLDYLYRSRLRPVQLMTIPKL